MASPNTALTTLRPDLASFEQFDLAMDRQGFIGQQVLPVINVAKPSGKFGKIKLEELMENRETARAPGAGYARGDWEFTDESFVTAEHGAEEVIDEHDKAVYAEYFEVETVSTQRAYDVILRNQEKRAAALVFNTSTWTGSPLTTAVGTPWSTAATATPITDIDAARQKVWDGTGMWPNALIITRKTLHYLRNVAQIIDRLKYQGFQDVRPSAITAQALAQVFDLDRVIVAGSAKNSATEGQDRSIASIWSNTMAMVCRIATTNDIKEPCIGRTFHWPGDGSSIGGTVETYREERVRGDIIRVRHEVQEKILYKELGHLLTSVTA